MHTELLVVKEAFMWHLDVQLTSHVEPFSNFEVRRWPSQWGMSKGRGWPFFSCLIYHLLTHCLRSFSLVQKTCIAENGFFSNPLLSSLSLSLDLTWFDFINLEVIISGYSGSVALNYTLDTLCYVEEEHTRKVHFTLSHLSFIFILPFSCLYRVLLLNFLLLYICQELILVNEFHKDYDF